MNRVGRHLSVAIIVVIMSTSCHVKYSKYSADWILTEFKIDGIDTTSIVGIYNFKLDLDRKVASPIGIYLPNKDYMLRDQIPFEISSANGTDYIKFSEHPVFSGDYKITCQDALCCELTLESSRVLLRLKYNGDLPYGKSRMCE